MNDEFWCECQNCGQHWLEPRDGCGSLRCSACGSKNIEIEDVGETYVDRDLARWRDAQIRR